MYLACINKQIITGPEGNIQIYLPREIQDRLPKSCIKFMVWYNNKNYYTMNFMQEQGFAKSRSHAHF